MTITFPSFFAFFLIRLTDWSVLSVFAWTLLKQHESCCLHSILYVAIFLPVLLSVFTFFACIELMASVQSFFSLFVCFFVFPLNILAIQSLHPSYVHEIIPYIMKHNINRSHHSQFQRKCKVQQIGNLNTHTTARIIFSHKTSFLYIQIIHRRTSEQVKPPENCHCPLW